MVHAKALVADDVAMVGSANLDQRSLLLNAESSLLLLDAADTAPVADWLERLAQDAAEGVDTPGHARQIVEGLTRLFGPLL